MNIRQETPSDVDAITHVTKLAFENHPYSRNTEQFIIEALRAADALTVSLVAEIDGELVGHLAFSPVTLSDGIEDWYGLGPISVLPACQRRGIGTALLNAGLAKLKDLGARGCLTVGDPGFYERFSFKSPRNLSHEGVPQENFLALPFAGKIPAGAVQFHPAFAATE